MYITFISFCMRKSQCYHYLTHHKRLGNKNREFLIKRWYTLQTITHWLGVCFSVTYIRHLWLHAKGGCCLPKQIFPLFPFSYKNRCWNKLCDSIYQHPIVPTDFLSNILWKTTRDKLTQIVSHTSENSPCTSSTMGSIGIKEQHSGVSVSVYHLLYSQLPLVDTSWPKQIATHPFPLQHPPTQTDHFRMNSLQWVGGCVCKQQYRLEYMPTLDLAMANMSLGKEERALRSWFASKITTRLNMLLWVSVTVVLRAWNKVWMEFKPNAYTGCMCTDTG